VAQRTRPRIGDVLQITTADGVAVVQYTHRHPEWGAVLRVFALGQASALASPDALTALAAGREQFIALFPLGSACQRGIAVIRGTAPIPVEAQPFPVFRSAARLPTGGRGPWWLWDGTRQWQVDSLTPEQRRLPLREVINDTLLVERASAGWHPELET
jgi:hypothetical protein